MRVRNVIAAKLRAWTEALLDRISVEEPICPECGSPDFYIRFGVYGWIVRCRDCGWVDRP